MGSRRRRSGVRTSLGARDGHILFLFLLEGAVIGLVAYFGFARRSSNLAPGNEAANAAN